jgi:Na+/H+ antiporter NhaD/arsenite permease-like protein
MTRWLVLALVFASNTPAFSAEPDAAAAANFPPSLESYNDSHLTSIPQILIHRARLHPFNIVATLLFFGAIIHAAMTHKFRTIAHHYEEKHEARRKAHESSHDTGSVPRVSGKAKFFHFLGEVEAVFGIWVLPLLVALTFMVGNGPVLNYMNHELNFTEPIFVVVIMAIASTRPVLKLAEHGLGALARLGGSTPSAWWLSILIAGPLLGSLITEPAAMTICAMLLSKKFYALNPSPKLAYGTIGLLFVSISTGGTLTHFAAPPVLMVAKTWNWNTLFMLEHFGWKSVFGIVVSALTYFFFFRKELRAMNSGRAMQSKHGERIPLWVTISHLAFMAFAVWHAHHSVYLVLGLLFFLAFVEVTGEFQRDFNLRAPVLVGFFLAGLVIHGKLQQWWIAPVLGSLSEVPLFVGALVLTMFNDNAAITYLCTLVPSFTEGMKYAAVAGAVVGGGMTVIANAPNPAGQSILNKHFQNGVSVSGLFLGALIPTLIQAVAFLMFRAVP